MKGMKAKTESMIKKFIFLLVILDIALVSVGGFMVMVGILK